MANRIWRPNLPNSRPFDKDPTTTNVHLRRVRQFEEETQWIAKNRNRFAGQWVAIRGGNLLAVGATAKEVFLKTVNEMTPPLVILVESGDAGW